MNTVFFDLDGTLLPMDTRQFESAYFKGLCRAVPELSPEKLTEYIWAGTKSMVKNDGSRTNRIAFADTFSKLSGLNFFENEPRFEDYYRTGFQECVHSCRPTAISSEIVHTLKEKGYRVVVATNPLFPQVATYSRLNWLGLSSEEFALVTTYENSHFAKPNPAYYEEICRTLSLNPSDCVMIGNDVAEDGAASSIGIPVVLVTDCLINAKNLPTDSYTLKTLRGVLEWAEQLPVCPESGQN
ncbi:MAG: HAD family hydrolase [Lachnospiraceae bacterium]